MSISKIISLVLLFVILRESKSVQSQICTFWKGVYYPSPWRSIVFDRHTFQDSKFLYAACNPSSHGKTCLVVRDKDKPFQDGNYTCNVNVKPSLKNGVLGEKFRVVPFGTDKAIVVWLERTNTETKLGLTSIKFYDCSWHEVRVNVDHSFDDSIVLDHIELLTYQFSYDLLYVNSRQCADKYCKLSVDVEANRISQPTSWFPIDRNNEIVDLKSIGEAADQRALLIESNDNECRFSILQDNAKTVLKVYETSGLTSVASTSSNELISTCHLSLDTLNCAQYNQLGTKIVESTNKLQNYPRVIAIYNLRGGAGLLVLLDDRDQNFVYVLRLDIRGNQVGKIDINNFQCDRNLNAVAGNFWDKDEQYCASVACYETDELSARKSDRGHLSATAKCFTLRNLQPIH